MHDNSVKGGGSFPPTASPAGTASGPSRYHADSAPCPILMLPNILIAIIVRLYDGGYISPQNNGLRWYGFPAAHMGFGLGNTHEIELVGIPARAGAQCIVQAIGAERVRRLHKQGPKEHGTHPSCRIISPGKVGEGSCLPSVVCRSSCELARRRGSPIRKSNETWPMPSFGSPV
jgi:hypothetical protein